MLRRHAIATLTTLLCLPILGVGCGEDEPATPQVIFEGNMQTTSATLEPDEKNCPETGPLFNIGMFGTPAAETTSKPIKDGESDQQGKVAVTCSVVPAADGEFVVSATASLSGATGGSFTLRQVKMKSEGTSEGVSAVFSKRTGNVYNQNDAGCTITINPPNEGVAPGRVWGVVDCPKTTNASTLTACRAIARFRFENCTQ